MDPRHILYVRPDRQSTGRGHSRTYEYSIRGDLTKLTMPDNTIEQWTYNGTGDITKYTSPFSGGQAYDIDYVFDNAGQLTTVDYDTGTDTTFQYDNSGRRTQMVDSTGTTTWTYNAADEVTSFVSPQGTVNRTFNTDGSLATMVDVGTGTTSYSYSSTTGQLTQVTNPYNEITAFLYDTLGRLERETKHSGEYTQVGYDARNRTTSIEHRKSDNTVLSSETYDYDDAGNLEQKVVGTVTTDYTYDDINQLLSEVRVGQNYSASYTYDANGNRATRTINNVTETFHNDSGDKLTHISVGGVTVKSYAYDAAGRRTGLQDSLGTATFVYDYESRITSISRSGSTTNTFTYNGLNTRVSKIDSAGTSTYRRAGAGVTSPVLGDGFANYTPGVSERRGSTTSYFQTDRLGTHKAQTNTSQAVTATRTFDAFGNLIASSGSSSSPFGFAGDWGYQEDPNYGLKLLGHRYYDPDAGRFLTRDPIKDGRNWYAFCGNNPLRWVDPTGLFSIGIGVGAQVVPFVGSVEVSANVIVEIGPRGIRFGLQETHGAGPALGLYGGVTKLSVTIDTDGQTMTGHSTSKTGGVTSTIGFVEADQDGTSLTIGTGPGKGIAAFEHQNESYSLDLTEQVGNLIGTLLVRNPLWRPILLS